MHESKTVEEITRTSNKQVFFAEDDQRKGRRRAQENERTSARIEKIQRESNEKKTTHDDCPIVNLVSIIPTDFCRALRRLRAVSQK
jgi:hypothetical protein